MLAFPLAAAESTSRPPREIVAEAAVQTDADLQKELVAGLATGDPEEVTRWLAKWKEGEIFLYQDAEGNDLAVLLEGEPDGDERFALTSLVTGEAVKGADGAPVRMKRDDLYMADTDSSLRRVMKGVTDRAALSSPDPGKRLRAVQDTGLEQDIAKLPLLEQLAASEQNGKVKAALGEAMAMLELRSPDPAIRQPAVAELGEMGSSASQ